jgi:hypothetical protein
VLVKDKAKRRDILHLHVLHYASLVELSVGLNGRLPSYLQKYGFVYTLFLFIVPSWFRIQAGVQAYTRVSESDT